MQNKQPVIPVFFSTDENYLPFLAVAIRSLINNLSQAAACRIYILNQGLSVAYARSVLDMATDRVSIELVDVSDSMRPIAEKLNLRDYYTASIYFRLFIPSLFPQYEKALYMDADVVVLGDIAELYSLPLENNLVAAVSDDIIASHETFRRYAEDAVGVPYRRYFNSGVMLMNLNTFRAEQIEQRFIYLLNTYHFDTICPDQDYLNVLCRDRVHYLDKGWNKMSIDEDYDGVPRLIHYNMFYKPWFYSDTCYGSYFWEYAKQVDFYEDILAISRRFGDNDRAAHRKAHEMLLNSAQQISQAEKNFKSVLIAVSHNTDEGRIPV